MATTYRNHFKKAKSTSFMKTAFDVFAFCNSKYSSKETNMLSRLKGTVSKAIEKRLKLPRFVVVVLDNDLIQFLAYINKGMASLIGELFEWLVECMLQLLKDRKSILPDRAVQDDYPQLYFVAPPRHRCLPDNNERKLLLNCMEATAKVFENARIIKMIEHWSFSDLDLVSDEGQFTSSGLTAYWSSINSAVAFNVKKRDEYLSRCGKSS